MAILEEVKEIITRYIKIEPEKITLESKLNEDLDADSIDIADVVMDIEEKYGFEFSDEDAENIVAITAIVINVEVNIFNTKSNFVKCPFNIPKYPFTSMHISIIAII